MKKTGKKKPVMMKFAFIGQIDESDVLRVRGKGARVSEDISKALEELACIIQIKL